MLFSSWPFIAAFLPITWFVYHWLMKKSGRRMAMYWMTIASLFFYGWFEWEYLLLIAVSVLFNHTLGHKIAAIPENKEPKRKMLLGFGVATNLGALFYYKYTGLFFQTLNSMGADFIVPAIILPIGISFFTFQSIVWLVDCYRRHAEKTSIADYTLFITFFPHLIAGPLVHHREMVPQFMAPSSPERLQRLLAGGLSLFLIGLFKKVAIADHMAEIADPIFNSAASGAPLTLVEAWLGPLAYTLQIYFDFSGYSDMAVGLAAMFGIRLPINFFSPYKSADIIEFWRRWHITLSRLLRDYLYIPLGGNRHGAARRHMNLMITMLLGGIWHGANWTYLVWGGLHGFYLIVAHMWKRLSSWRLPRPVGVALTFVSVMVAWVFFRAETIDTAFHIIRCMTGVNGVALQDTTGWIADAFKALGADIKSMGDNRNLRINEKWYLLWIALIAVFVLPSMHQVMRGRLALDVTRVAQNAGSLIKFYWRPTLGWGLTIGLAAGLSMTLLTRVNAFIYFQF